MAQTIKNLASGRLTADITAVATSLSVYVGEGTSVEIEGVWPDTPFYATIVPNEPVAGVPNSLDSEIVKITAVSSDQNGNTILTATRAQRDTLARAFSAGAIVTNAIYVDDAVVLGPESTEETEQAWVGTDELEDGAVTAAKMDLSTMGFNNTNAVVIGSFVDGDNTSHTIYRKMYKFTNYTMDTTTPYKQFQVDLANYTIIGSQASLYRSDAHAVINTTGKDLEVIFTGSGDYARVYYNGGIAQNNATVYLTIDYMD